MTRASVYDFVLRLRDAGILGVAMISRKAPNCPVCRQPARPSSAYPWFCAKDGAGTYDGVTWDLGPVKVMDETTEITPEAYRFLALKADAERLAELRGTREQYAAQVDWNAEENPPKADRYRIDIARLDILIAVYEECAARGIAFVGGR